MAVSLGRKDGSRDEVERSFESYDPLRDPSMRPTPFQAYVRIRSAATSSAPTASCPACAAPSRAARPSTSWPRCGSSPARAARKSRCWARRSTATAIATAIARRGWATCSPRCTTSTGIERIKFVTNYPKDMTDDLLAAVRDLPKVCQVPARAGAERLERRAQADEARLHGRATTARCSRRIRERVPEAAVTSDFIVGFCGETEETSQRPATWCASAGSRTASSSSTARGPARRATSCSPTTCPRR